MELREASDQWAGRAATVSFVVNSVSESVGFQPEKAPGGEFGKGPVWVPGLDELKESDPRC